MKKVFFFIGFFVFPFVVFAEPVENPALNTLLGGLILKVFYLLNLVLPIIGALALIWFFWGIIQYVLKGENIEKREQSRDFMIYAVIAFFVMFSIWGLVHLVQRTFFFGGPHDPLLQLRDGDIPTVPVLKK